MSLVAQDDDNGKKQDDSDFYDQAAVQCPQISYDN